MKKEFFMNYAEGQGAPTVKYEDKEVAEKEAARLAEKLGVEVTTLQAVTAAEPKDITKRVKSYADACAVLGIEPMNEEVLVKLGFTGEEIARRKVGTIAEALNEGWVPNWNDTDEYKYYPWFYIEPNNSGAYAGLSCALTLHTASTTSAFIGSRLCFKTSALARYAGETFTELYTQFLIN
jgi:hypothetical protein